MYAQGLSELANIREVWLYLIPFNAANGCNGQPCPLRQVALGKRLSRPELVQLVTYIDHLPIVVNSYIYCP